MGKKSPLFTQLLVRLLALLLALLPVLLLEEANAHESHWSKLLNYNCPWVKHYCLDIKHQEKDGEEIVADV